MKDTFTAKNIWGGVWGCYMHCTGGGVTFTAKPLHVQQRVLQTTSLGGIQLQDRARTNTKRLFLDCT